MMKIIVDEMPKCPEDCTYCKDYSDMDHTEYRCTWQNCGRCCFDTEECPFFTSDCKSNSTPSFWLTI